MQLALADMTGCLYCVKLVRGAYTEQERERAKDIGYPDPIWPNKQSTDDCYHRLLELLMKERTGTPSSPAHFMVASHNEATIKFVTEKYAIIIPALSPWNRIRLHHCQFYCCYCIVL